MKLYFLFLILVTFGCCGQSIVAQSYPGTKEPAYDFYSKTLGVGSHLYNGREYKMYIPWKEEHPYLYEDWIASEIKYDDNLYQDIPLLYDLSMDEVVIKYINDEDVQLIRNKVSYFVLRNRKFILRDDANLKAGFYELLYDGKVKIYSRQEKKLVETITGSSVNREFEEKTKFYVFTNGSYYPVKSKKTFLEIFPVYANALKKFIRDKKLSFKASFGNSLVSLAEYVDQLK